MTIPPSLNEKHLLQQIAEGNETAFRDLYNLHWNRIYSLALAYLKSGQLAQDVVQEVFLKLWDKREKLKIVENPEAFIFIIGRNEVVNALKKKINFSSIDEDTHDYLPDDFMSPPQQVDVKELQQKIDKAIDALPPQQKLIFKLSRTEGLTHEQIAERLGIEKATVKNHMIRALNKLRQALQLQGNNLLFWFILVEWFMSK